MRPLVNEWQFGCFPSALTPEKIEDRKSGGASKQRYKPRNGGGKQGKVWKAVRVKMWKQRLAKHKKGGVLRIKERNKPLQNLTLTNEMATKTAKKGVEKVQLIVAGRTRGMRVKKEEGNSSRHR